MDASMRDALAEVEKDRSQLSGVIVSRFDSCNSPKLIFKLLYTGLPQVFQANVLARVRVKVKHKGKAEKEQMLVGAAKETHNSKSKAGLYSATTRLEFALSLFDTLLAPLCERCSCGEVVQ